MTERTLSEPRPVTDLEADTSGQLATEWVMVTAAVVIPLLLLIPYFLGMINVYFSRVAEVISSLFP